jgi:ABC-type sugar transport system substrate-binding protein
MILKNRLSARSPVGRALVAGAAFSSFIAIAATGTAISSVGTAGASTPFKVCMGTGGQGLNWEVGQGVVLQSIAKKEGWTSVILSNDNSAPTALTNVETFIQDNCSVVLEFNGQPSENPVMALKLAAAHIPAITYDIGQKGWYFVGIDNLKAGIEGGQMLGTIIKSKWNCTLDAILASEGPGAGIVNTERTGGMVTGVLKECPNLKSKVVQFVGNGQISTALPAARTVLAAHPKWDRIAVVGINDSGVVGALEAAEQLGRAKDIIGWGQDGSLVTGSNVDPHLLGSVFYFLEGYPEFALPLLKAIAAGHAPAMADDTHNNPAVQIQPCPVSVAQARKVPLYGARVSKMLTVAPGTTENSLFCPTS